MTGRGRFIVGWLLALLGGTLMLGGLWSGTVRADSRKLPLDPERRLCRAGLRQGVASTPMRSPRPR